MKSSLFLAVFFGLALPAIGQAAEWPVYRGNLAHTGASAEDLPGTLAPAWVYSAPAKPQTGMPGDEGRTVEGHALISRVKFDDCLHAVAAGGRVYFGSSVDHQVHCVDANTGRSLWTFFTDGPVRLTPSVAEGRLYFGSDDGHAYCLDAETGSLVWKLRAGPHDERLLARGEMISRWPVRTSVLVDNGVAYFGAGIFPHENIYLYAVNAADGKVVWVRDNISQQDAGRDDLSPQGYLLASDELLFVPSGRSLPAAVNRTTGEILHKRIHAWRSTAGGVIGGTEAMLADGQIYSSGAHHFLAIDERTGDVGFGYFDGHQMAISGDAAFTATGQRLSRLDRLTYAVSSRAQQELDLEISGLARKLRDAGAEKDAIQAQLDAARKKLDEFRFDGVTWSVETPHDSSLIVAGDAVVAGGKNAVAIFDATTGANRWTAEVDGDARGLATAGGRLLVSTTSGKIYCFAAEGAATAIATSTPAAAPYPQDEHSELYASAAQAILDRTGVRRGFCLIAGSEEGRLAYELAKRSQLTILGVEPDERKAAAARRALDAAGLYGHRVTIHHGDLGDIPYSNFFANLIVSDSLLRTGKLTFDPAALVRHLKPVGGVICLGRPTGAADQVTPATLTSWLEATGLKDQATITADGTWATLVRGPLPGAGNWTHQYGDAGNTASSDDTRVKGGLGVLWFGDPGPNSMVNRHDGAVGPLTVNGRLFVQGEHKVMAYDAYNGLFLWEYENPEAHRTGVFNNVNPGNVAAGPESVFMFAGNLCHEIDAATGKARRLHRLPPGIDGPAYQWGYVAYHEGMLFGTATVRTELAEQMRRRGRKTDDFTDTVFAIDVATGDHAWQHRGANISHHTVAIGPGRVFFIDSSITSEVREALLLQDKAALKELPPAEAKAAEERMKRLDVRMAVALDAKTGRQLWMLPVDVTDCSEIGIGGGKLSLLYDQGVLLLCGANANGHYWQQFVKGEFSRRRLVALSSQDGATLWAKDANYRHRPIIVGDRVIAEPWAFNLYNGEQQTRPNVATNEPEPWSIMRTGHHCGMLTASENMLFFRSGFTGYYDLTGDTGAQHFAGHRLGCWINAIPANGLVMIPEAGAGCVCMFSIESTVVLEPREARRPWSIYSAVGELTPVKHLAVNLGAPGDRRDALGKLWLTYPRPKPYRETSLELKLSLDTKFAEGGGFTSVNEESHPIAGGEAPWIFASWARGLTECSLPLLGEKDPPARYTVKLYFADLENSEPGQRVFDVELQGQRVDQDLDIVKASGGKGKALVREYKDIEVSRDLKVRLVPQSGGSSLEVLPTLSAIEVTRVGD
jgi:outer membrane protein assembly factor BamB